MIYLHFSGFYKNYHYNILLLIKTYKSAKWQLKKQEQNDDVWLTKE